MMNKKRSNGIGRTKYLIFVPLAGFLMLFSNIEAVARITGKIAAEAVAEVKEATEISLVSADAVKVKGQVIDDFNGPVIGANVLVKGTNVGTITDLDGNFVLETTKDAVLVFSFPGTKAKEVAVKDVLGDLKVQLYSDGTIQRSQSGTASPAPQRQSDAPQMVSDQVFTVVEVMPEYPGGQGELLKYLAKSIKYPVIAQENGIQGRVTASFIIEKDGSIRNIEVIRGVDPSLDAEAVRVLSGMPNWTPGKQRGQDVAVKYTVPVTFRLQGKTENQPTPGKDDVVVVGYGSNEADKATDSSDQVFAMVEKMPEFPGGQNGIINYLQKTMQYPKDAQEKGLQGRVICSFIIEKDGSITNAEVMQGIEPSLDQEALRVVNAMPKWSPGMQRGKAVRVKYTVPLTFTLQ